MGAVPCLLKERPEAPNQAGQRVGRQGEKPVGVGTAACWLPLAPGAEEGGEGFEHASDLQPHCPIGELRLRCQTGFRPQGST